MTGRAHVIVLGNEKGGAGKSTTAMHLFVALARAGHRVGALDLDLRQQSFFRYLQNREALGRRVGKPLLMPERLEVGASRAALREDAADEERAALAAAIGRLSETCRFIVVDTPGAVTTLSEAAHAAADTLVTPINDSLVDFDLLGRVDPVSGRVTGPSIYAEMVWSARQRRAAAGRPPMDWVVLRNRISMLESRNKRKVGKVMEELSQRIGFRIAPGFSERVIFRELFLNGLTLLDLKQGGAISITMSHIAARQEVRDMVKALELPDVAALV
ncbi:division plane positioning ATPase MipZ [Limibaculum sp. FT325]|uniref:division plane positioning ATPase MipZ n=1 Tax=Thermohalobaculum sediminis TaxID=2939436 RepID=UPI0020BED612|nr:division plane positioning ATPase MipZ [Limibaculum sediminis]MCL5777911.1 division plane positioning ATPase MipZ [Limibaculum sediminis]